MKIKIKNKYTEKGLNIYRENISLPVQVVTETLTRPAVVNISENETM
jgi:hypothetical protein